MTTTAAHRRTAGSHAATVDIAGTAWPLHKLEAVAAWLGTFLLVLTVTQVLQIAVLTAAVVAVVVWWVRRALILRRKD
ncbi:hypothetical protein ERC79_01765 [Rhodococcus sp. ABRD24]|uniref:hypothetical protein n=1 Tax=Rhodococcus sp. ABRD24 TaxID=2507582 RepID=UPI00103D941D|nr:hypothetical protein [Rhodococcus sp. ABRD24]QBJ94832.1 hypothetical protein ERC79_01765 [Rhodococcus sp. ABRD24]